MLKVNCFLFNKPLSYFEKRLLKNIWFFLSYFTNFLISNWFFYWWTRCWIFFFRSLMRNLLNQKLTFEPSIEYQCYKITAELHLTTTYLLKFTWKSKKNKITIYSKFINFSLIINKKLKWIDEKLCGGAFLIIFLLVLIISAILLIFYNKQPLVFRFCNFLCIYLYLYGRFKSLIGISNWIRQPAKWTFFV